MPTDHCSGFKRTIIYKTFHDQSFWRIIYKDFEKKEPLPRLSTSSKSYERDAERPRIPLPDMGDLFELGTFTSLF